MNAYWKTTLTMLLVGIFSTAHAHASIFLQEDFEGPSTGGGVVYGGAYVPGFEGNGWTSKAASYYSDSREFIEYGLPSGFPVRNGTIEFYVQRIKGDSIPRKQDAVIEFLDANHRSLLLVGMAWKDFTGNSAVLLTGSAYIEQLGGEPYGEFVNLGRNVPVGEWLHIALTWGASPAQNQLFVNGKAVTAGEKRFGKEWKPNPQSNVSTILAATAFIRVGAETMATALDRSYSPLNESIVDRLRIHDVAFNPFDTTPPEPVARVLAEPGFGGEIKVSWTASPSGDVTLYEIYRGQGKEPDPAVPPLQRTGALAYSDMDIVPGLEYFYRVVAVDGVNLKSVQSETAKATAPSGNGPRIASVAVEPAGKPLRPGDTVKIILTGEPGGKGLVDIQNLQADLVLTEEGGRTGRYVGTLPITAAEVATERQTLQVVGKLSDAYGASQLAGPSITIVSAADLNDKTPPVITELTHDGFAQAGFSGKLVAGDTLTVTLAGEAGGSASFRLVGVTDQQALAEVAPGLYKGSYTLGFEDEGEKVAVEATLADFAGNPVTAVAAKTVDLDTRVRLVVTARESLLPADRESKTRVTVRAEDANGDDVEGHELALTLSTTSEYTGVVGGGKVEDKFAAKDDVDDIEVKWGGTTDSFGEIAATYTAGFAAKTALILAKDMTTGDMGAGWVNTYVASTVAIELIPRAARDAADLAQMTMSITPSWLTADGRSKARVKAWLTDFNNAPIAGAVVNFTLGGTNGSVKVLRGVTDEKGLAEAEYRAGTLAGFETITAAAPDYHVTRSMQIELRSDAPAKIDLTASAVSLPADGRSTSNITAVVSDINDNRNPNVPVMFKVLEGGGAVAPAQANTNLTGVVEATYTAGTTPGIAVVEARHTSRAPTVEELRRIAGTVFVPRFYKGQEGDRIKVTTWLAEEGDDVAKGQPLVEVETSEGTWTIPAAEKGILVRHVRHKRDRVETGETLGYVEIDPEVWEAQYLK